MSTDTEQRPATRILGKAKPSQSRVGVPLYAVNGTQADYRTYEIYQREREHEATEKIRPIELMSADFVRDPYPLLAVLRENYPCYRNWLGNAYWVTQYNDVTSLFQDDANFVTRPRLWYYRMEGYGRDLRRELPVLVAQAKAMDDQAEVIADEIVADMRKAGGGNLATDFAARFAMTLLARTLDLPPENFHDFVTHFWRLQRGYDWDAKAEQAGKQSMAVLADMFRPLLAARRDNPGDDLISAIATLDLPDGPATAEDIVVTLLEGDHETLQGGLSNMWFLLLTHSGEMQKLRDDGQLTKFAWLEMLRHSTPVPWVRRYCRHEVERFGRLLPIGGLMILAAAAGNRDPRIFKDPDQFIVGRKDLCQREPRGHYRADGLAAGIAFGLGKPSIHPAVPEDRPRSLYALTRDVATRASRILLEKAPDMRLADGARPELRSLRLNEMHTCWELPVVF